MEDERDAAIEASEAKSDSLEDELELLQKRNEELKDTTEYYDKLLNLQKLKRDNTHVVIDEATGKEVYTYDRQAVKEAEGELEQWWADKAYDNQVDALQDQIDKQKEYTDQIKDEYDKRIDSLKEAQEKEKNALADALQKEKEAFNIYWEKVLSDEQLNIEARTLEQEHGYENALNGLNGFFDNMKEQLDAENAEMLIKGQALSNSFLSGFFSTLEEGVSQWLDSNGRVFGEMGINITPDIVRKDINNIIAEMFRNSQGWASAKDESTRNVFADNNRNLGGLIGANYDSSSGIWSVNGKNIYDILPDSLKKSIKATVDNTGSNELIQESNEKVASVAKTVKESLVANSSNVEALTDRSDDLLDACNALIKTYSGIDNSISAPVNHTSSSGNTNNSSQETSPPPPKEDKENVEPKYQNYTSTYQGSGQNVKTEIQGDQTYRYIDNGDGTQDIEIYSSTTGNLLSMKKNVKKKHTGIKTGLVGSLKENDKIAFLKRIAIDGLKSDEVPTILQEGEGVFTEKQMDNISNALMAGEISSNVLKVYESTLKVPVTNSTPTTVEKGDTIVIQNMTVKADNAETFMRQLKLKAGRV